MSFEYLSNVLNDTIHEAEEFVVQESTKEKTISTPLFTLTFHNMETGGVLVDGANGLFLGDLFNLCDRLVVRIATATVNIQELLFGLEATATNKTKPIGECFDDQFNLLPKWKEKLTEKQQKTAITLAAEIHAYMVTLSALIKARAQLLPMAKRELQLAWNSEKQQPITNLSEALKYRIMTGNTRKSVLKRWNDQKTSSEQVTRPLSLSSLADLLN